MKKKYSYLKQNVIKTKSIKNNQINLIDQSNNLNNLNKNIEIITNTRRFQLPNKFEEQS